MTATDVEPLEVTEEEEEFWNELSKQQELKLTQKEPQ